MEPKTKAYIDQNLAVLYHCTIHNWGTWNQSIQWSESGCALSLHNPQLGNLKPKHTVIRIWLCSITAQSTVVKSETKAHSEHKQVVYYHSTIQYHGIWNQSLQWSEQQAMDSSKLSHHHECDQSWSPLPTHPVSWTAWHGQQPTRHRWWSMAADHEAKSRSNNNNNNSNNTSGHSTSPPRLGHNVLTNSSNHITCGLQLRFLFLLLSSSLSLFLLSLFCFPSLSLSLLSSLSLCFPLLSLSVPLFIPRWPYATDRMLKSKYYECMVIEKNKETESSSTSEKSVGGGVCSACV